MTNIAFDEKTFNSKFPQSGFLVQHDLTDNALFDYEGLAELASRLPAKSIEHNASDLNVNQDVTTVKQSSYSPSDAILNAEQAKTWVVIKNVEQDKQYKQLMHDTLSSVIEPAQRRLGSVDTMEAFIFVSSPNSVTPFHIDPEHNFLLQIKGEKTVYQWAKGDEATLPGEYLEEHTFNGSHRNLEYREDFADRQTVFTMQPGDGLYFPVRAPHWVKNGSTTSISFSVTFRSAESERETRLYQHNWSKRSAGGNPYPVHKNRLVDTAKDTWIRANRRIKALGGSNA